MVLSEIIRFLLPSSRTSSSAFLKLRDQVKAQGVKDQYFGYTIPGQGFPSPKRDEMCWVIQWPENCALRTNDAFISQLIELAGKESRSLLFRFKDTNVEQVAKGLEAPFCQFAVINLNPSSPFSHPEFQHSMDKTFTDSYLAQGFVGGGWNYALNTTDATGLRTDSVEDRQHMLKEDERRLAVYYLGWESLELHHAYATTALFDEEIDKLKPWFGEGTGAWYASFEKHV